MPAIPRVLTNKSVYTGIQDASMKAYSLFGSAPGNLPKVAAVTRKVKAQKISGISSSLPQLTHSMNKPMFVDFKSIR